MPPAMMILAKSSLWGSATLSLMLLKAGGEFLNHAQQSKLVFWVGSDLQAQLEYWSMPSFVHF
jgi:hypothetical protein